MNSISIKDSIKETKLLQLSFETSSNVSIYFPCSIFPPHLTKEVPPPKVFTFFSKYAPCSVTKNPRVVVEFEFIVFYANFDVVESSS